MEQDFNYTIRISKTDRRIDLVLNYIVTHMNQPMTLKDVAEVACLSQPALCNWLKNCLGKPLWKFYKKLKSITLASYGQKLTGPCLT